MYKQSLSLIAAATLVTSLEANTLNLDPILVSASKTEQSLKEVTANVHIITAKEIEEKHLTTVAEALNLLSGISLTSNGGLGKSTSVYLQGFDSKRILVLIDGIRYNDPTGLSGAPFEHLMISNIERIEVVKGAQSGIWGADASAGVINIITKSTQKGLHGTLNGEVGSFNTQKYGAGASYGADNYYISVSSNVVDTDGFSAQAPRGVDLDTFEDDGYKNTTTTLKAGYTITPTNKVELQHTIIDAENEGDPYNNPNGIYNSTASNRFSSLNFNHVDNVNELNLYAKRSSFERNYPQDLYTKEFDGVVTEYGVSSKIPYLNDDFILIGGDYKSFEHLNTLNEKYTDRGLFATNCNTFNDQTTLTESIRIDNHDTFNDKTTGKIGIKHYFDQALFVSSNYGTAYNVPTIYNLYGPYGNTALTAESARSYDVSFSYKAMTLTYFYNTIKDMIDFDMTTWKYTNIAGTSTFKGVEAEYQQEIIAKTLLTLNYTHLSAKDNTGADLARRAKETFKFGIDYDGIEKLHVGVYGEYIGERYDDKLQTKPTGHYTLVNTAINYDFTKSFGIYVKVDNLTDKYYQTVDGYATSPRAWYTGLKASF